MLHQDIEDLIRQFAGSTLTYKVLTQIRFINVLNEIKKRRHQKYLLYKLTAYGLCAIKRVTFCACRHTVFCNQYTCYPIFTYSEYALPNIRYSFIE